MIHFDSFSISKREIIISIAIIALMLVFGFMIHGAINDSLMLQYQEYNTALQIKEDTEMFKHAMETNVGNAFVYFNGVCVCLVKAFIQINNDLCIRRIGQRLVERISAFDFR